MCLYWKVPQFCELVNSISTLNNDTFNFTIIFDMFHDLHVRYFIFPIFFLKEKYV